LGILNDFERRLGGIIEGLFTKAFRTGLQPVELATRILREMETNKTVGVREVWVPNHFVFTLSAPDRERFQGAEKGLRRELERVVRDGAPERGWSLLGPAQVEFETDPSLNQGEYGCVATLVEGPTGAQPAVAAGSDGRAELVLIEHGKPGKTYPLIKQRAVIGRLAESDVVLSDPGASRRHAEVRRDGDEFVLVDLGSTNGTMVNESTVGERTLQDGDRITIGRTVLEFRRR
jgi:FHA domain-containing protein